MHPRRSRPSALARADAGGRAGRAAGLIALGLAWELWLAPTGSGTLALKVLPLLPCVAGLLRHRMYTFRWLSLLVWLYVLEGAGACHLRAAAWDGAGWPLARSRSVAVLFAASGCLHPLAAAQRGGRRDPRPAHDTKLLGRTARRCRRRRRCSAKATSAPGKSDWRRRWHGKSLAVVRPASTAEVAAVVTACAAAGTAIVPQGGNTGLVGGGVPDGSGRQVLLSLQRMNRVRAIDEANLTLTAEAGCVLQTVQDAAADSGLLFPLSLAAEGSCTIGGNLATNAGGTQVLRWGNARELCLGLEVVTAAGEVWDGLSGLRKDNTGYDLRDLFIGSEGTLGIITAATLKLAPRPAATTTALAACASVAQCVALLKLARTRLGAGLTGFEMMGRYALDLTARHFPALPRPLPEAPWTVLLEQSDTEGEAPARQRFEALLGAALEAGIIDDAVVAESLAQSRALWHVRESIPLAQSEEGLEHQARHLAAGVGHPRLRRCHRRGAAPALARRAARQLRPPGRRQPALQRAGASGCRWPALPRRSTNTRSTSRVRRGGRASAARFRPSTASAC